MSEWFETQAAAGSLALAVPVAVIAGLVSFFSPCVIPLLPGYLSYATGLSGADLASGEAARHRGRMLLGSVLFVLGFAVVFVLLGAAFGGGGVVAPSLAGRADDGHGCAARGPRAGVLGPRAVAAA
ncbi:cytochrome c biogenesis protein CcdA [Nocardioides sp. TF02-7]|uniref:cytochrome c biogenesis CcdA family protein n=1 Tax=Nocardioides sp. TF02-7 TaxID=2917724 RepID=UPI001F0707A3|nr:cytochrome c biogenesis protein CcdA [Nocardioides sp. TF02-7]